MFIKPNDFFIDPQINYPKPEKSFEDYIDQSKNIFKQHRSDLSPEIMELLLPFEFRPKNPIKKGALLIHGLLDTPFTMRDIGLELKNQGLLVQGILLPGHGIKPSCLLHIRLNEWVQTVAQAIDLMAKEVDQIYLVGYSTGATLALYHVLKNPEKIAGLILLAPAFKIGAFYDFLIPMAMKISSLAPRLAWLSLHEETDYARYRSLCLNGVHQVHLLAKEINRIDHKKELPCPMMIALSYEDRIVYSPTSIDYFLNFHHADSRMIIYSSQQLQYQDPRVLLRNSFIPEFNILNFSHVCLPFSPTNRHYGIHGDFGIASHIDEHSHIYYSELDKIQAYFYQLAYSLKLTHYKRQRLSFNPDFDFLIEQMNQFINT